MECECEYAHEDVQGRDAMRCDAVLKFPFCSSFPRRPGDTLFPFILFSHGRGHRRWAIVDGTTDERRLV